MQWRKSSINRQTLSTGSFTLVVGTVSLFGTLAGALFYSAAIDWPITQASGICSDSGRGLALKAPFARQGDHGYVVTSVGKGGSGSDEPNNPTRSKAILCEDGRVLGPAHSSHDVIRSKGDGSYSHWAGALYFSTSDNTDPGTNGRSYRLILQSGEDRS